MAQQDAASDDAPLSQSAQSALRSSLRSSSSAVQLAQHLHALRTDVTSGLSSHEASLRLQQHGANELAKEAPKSAWSMLWEQLSSALVLMLIAASCISMLTSQFAAAATILLIILANAALGVVQESKAGAALSALESLAAPSADVLRDGRIVTVASTAVVPGDVLLLEVGNKLVADLIIVEAHDLQVNEMALTGESEPVDKCALQAKGGKLLPGGDAQPLHLTPLHKPQTPSDSAAASRRGSLGTGAGSTLTDPHQVYMGCSVTEGRGKAVCCATGMKTKMGEVAHLLQAAEAGQSPLQAKLEKLGQQLGLASLAVSVLVFVIGVSTGRGSDPHSDQPVWLQMLLVAVSLTVAAVPEGLPTCVTITLAIGMHNMVKKHALIRNLHSVETLGSCSVICTDKTGTLTAGCMTAVKLFFSGRHWRFSGIGYETRGALWSDGGNHVVSPKRSLMNGSSGGTQLNGLPQQQSDNVGAHTLPILCALLCSNAQIQSDGSVHGNSSDKPIVVAAAKLGLVRSALDAVYARRKELVFDSNRKMMSVVVACSDRQRVASTFGSNAVAQDAAVSLLVCSKGAPDVVLAKCEHLLEADPHDTTRTVQRSMTADERRSIQQVVNQYSSQALRVLAVAYKPLPSAHPAAQQLDTLQPHDAATLAALESQLVFTGLIGLQDPVRESVHASIEQAARAGIRTVMITGDFLLTASAIARQVGIGEQHEQRSASDSVSSQHRLLDGNAPQSSGRAIDCSELRRLNASLAACEAQLNSGALNSLLKLPLRAQQRQIQSEIDAITALADVYSRAQPSDKITIVRSLQRQGHVVCMTGDGVNDAPALKQANIGVSMGLTGTDVAKAASDMVLTTDDFCSIVDAVEEGRTIYNNISKFVFFLLSTNIAEVVVILVCVIAGMQSPLLPIQLLWLNLVTDGAPAIALALEGQEPGTMSQGPRKLNERLMDTMMLVGITIQTVVLSLVCIGTFMIGCKWHANDWTGDHDAETQSVHSFQESMQSARTMTCLLIVFAELLRAYTSRTLRVSVFQVGLFSNVFMQYSVGISVLATLLISHQPHLMEIFSFNYLSKREWTVVLVGSCVPVTVDELCKLVYRRTGFGTRPRHVSGRSLAGSRRSSAGPSTPQLRANRSVMSSSHLHASPEHQLESVRVDSGSGHVSPVHPQQLELTSRSGGGGQQSQQSAVQPLVQSLSSSSGFFGSSGGEPKKHE